MRSIIDAVTSTDKCTRRWKVTITTAYMAYEAGDQSNAQRLLSRALDMSRELPEREFAALACEVCLAATLIAAGNTVDAEQKLRASISKLEGNTDSPMKDLLAVALRFHAQALIENRQYQEAEQELLRASDIFSSLGTNAALQLAFSQSDLAGLLLLQNRITEAQNWAVKAMQHLAQFASPSDKEYIRAGVISAIVMPMSESDRLLAVRDGLERLQYAYGEHHPAVTQAVQSYLGILKHLGRDELLQAAEQRFTLGTSAKPAPLSISQ